MSFGNSYLNLQDRSHNESFATSAGTYRRESFIAMRAVEVPLTALATATVCLRLYSRLAVKRKIALDDILIVLALV